MSIERLIEQLGGRRITGVTAGGTNGSIIILEMDRRFLLYVYCAWRLEFKETILTGWNDSNDPVSGVLVREIKKLQDEEVSQTTLSPFHDLQIKFLSDKVLNIFCDITSNSFLEALDENWWICDMDSNRCLIVNKDHAVLERPYKKQE